MWGATGGSTDLELIGRGQVWDEIDVCCRKDIKPTAAVRARERESKECGDILQSNQFDDDYRASSLKTLQLFQWCATFCKTSKYVTRIDNDVWVNVPAYFEFFRQKWRRGRATGSIIPRGYPVIRDPSHKGYLWREEFPADVLLRYMSGAIFATPIKALGKILAAHSLQPVTVFLDDVYVIGQLMPLVSLSFINMPQYVDSERVKLDECGHKHMLAIHHARLTHIYSYWNNSCTTFKSVCREVWTCWHDVLPLNMNVFPKLKFEKSFEKTLKYEFTVEICWKNIFSRRCKLSSLVYTPVGNNFRLGDRDVEDFFEAKCKPKVSTDDARVLHTDFIPFTNKFEYEKNSQKEQKRKYDQLLLFLHAVDLDIWTSHSTKLRVESLCAEISIWFFYRYRFRLVIVY